MQFLKNKERLALHSWVYSNQTMAFTLFNFLVSRFNKLYTEQLTSPATIINMSPFIFNLTKNDYEYIINVEYPRNKDEYFSKKDKLLSTTEQMSFDDFADLLSPLVLFANPNEIVFNTDKLKSYITNNIKGLTLESPLELSNLLRINISRHMKYNYLESNLLTEPEKLLISIFEDGVSIDKIKPILHKSLLLKIKSMPAIYDSKLTGFSSFLVDLISQVSEELSKIEQITDSFKIQTQLIIDASKLIQQTSDKRTLIQSYLNKVSMNTFSKFYQSNTTGTIRNHIQRFDIFVQLLEEFFLLHEKHLPIVTDWNISKKNALNQIDKLAITITNTIKSLKAEDLNLEMDAKIDFVFQKFVPEDSDSEKKKTDRKIAFLNFIEHTPEDTSITVNSTSIDGAFKSTINAEHKLFDTLLQPIFSNPLLALSDEEFEQNKLERENLEKAAITKTQAHNKVLEQIRNIHINLASELQVLSQPLFASFSQERFFIPFFQSTEFSEKINKEYLCAGLSPNKEILKIVEIAYKNENTKEWRDKLVTNNNT